MAPASNPLAALLSNGNFSVPVMLDVGGYKHRTTLQTLLAAQGSLFWQLVQGSGPEGLLHQLPNGDIFIDRNGSVFGHILEYLRACVNGEVACNPLPHNARSAASIDAGLQGSVLTAQLSRVHIASWIQQLLMLCSATLYRMLTLYCLLLSCSAELRQVVHGCISASVTNFLPLHVRSCFDCMYPSLHCYGAHTPLKGSMLM